MPDMQLKEKLCLDGDVTLFSFKEWAKFQHLEKMGREGWSTQETAVFERKW